MAEAFFEAKQRRPGNT